MSVANSWSVRLTDLPTSDQFFGLEKDNPHDHIRWFNKITSTIKYKDVPNSEIKLMLFLFSFAEAARRWLEKELPHSILTWEDLVSKFINEFFPLSRTKNLRNEISNFQQRFDETFHEAWDRYKDLLRACPRHGFIELHQLDTFYNALNPVDQDSLNSAAGGNVLERRTQDVLMIIENKSKFLRYIDTRPNGEALRKCILSGPYKPTTILVQAVEATNDSPAILEHTTVETPMNMSPEKKAYFEAEKEAIHLTLTGIGDEIYSNPEWSRSHKSHASSPKPSIPTRSHTTTRHKGKEIAKPITPPSETGSEEDIDHEQAQRDKDTQKNLALIAKYFKKIYKPTNNNLRTSSNSRNKNVYMTLWFKNGNQFGQFGNQRTVNVVGAREKVGSPAEQYDWLADTNEQVDEQELEAHYSYMAKIQQVPTADSGTDSEPLEKVQYDAGYNVFANDLQHFEQSKSVNSTCLVETNGSNVISNSPDMCKDDIQNDQNDVESDDERVALANLKLDVDENKKIQKKLKKANTTLSQELKECKAILAKTSKSLGESISVEIVAWFHFRPSRLSLRSIRILMTIPLTTTNLNKIKVIMDLKLREEHDIEKMLSMEKQLKFLNEVVYKRSQSIQTIHIMAPKVPKYNGRPTFTNLRYLKQAQSEIPCLYAFLYDQSTHANRLIPDGE
uniref:Reverse transcriptase domain-containing protein n=1 Tax=Tanacetum cinerariifolium TaxID=118510 RepID=A0A6L2LTH1_TANCI|nr:reverse transcriptase domain-containing protein [Tanacetum cinerariifolium]